MFTDIVYEESDHIGVITINRPEKHNALRFTTYDEIEEVVRTTRARALIITGEGRSFCSGDDLQEVMLGGETRPRKYDGITPLGAALLETDVPTIAAVNGAAVGWGMEMSLLCDLRVASTRARFGEVFVKRGLVPDAGGMTRLESIVGRQEALRLLLTGDIIDASEARRIGLVLDVVDDGDLLPRARDLAGSIAVNPPLAVRRTKEGLRLASARRDYVEFGQWFAGAIADLKQTSDHKESVAAFLEKRPPQFTGE